MVWLLSLTLMKYSENGIDLVAAPPTNPVLADPLFYIWYQSLFHSPVSYLPMQLFLIKEPACDLRNESLYCWTFHETVPSSSHSWKFTLPMQFILKYGFWLFYH